MTIMTVVPAYVGVRDTSMRPWLSSDPAHTGDLATSCGVSRSAASRVVDGVTFLGDTVARITGHVRPHFEAPPG
ncbi:MAG: hypothetical protein ACRCYX_15520 [Dermatophilaceae bacterium]